MLKLKQIDGKSPEPAIFITTPEARQIVKEEVKMNITKVTMLTWVNKYGLGRKIGGRYQVDKNALLEFLHRGRGV